MQRADSLEKTDAGKDWRKEDRGAREDERVGSHYWLNGLMFEQTLRDSEGQGSLAWCSPWAHKESDTTWGLNNKQRVSWPKLTPLSGSISNDRLMAEGRTEGIKPWLLSLTRTTLQCLSSAKVLCGIGYCYCCSCLNGWSLNTCVQSCYCCTLEVLISRKVPKKLRAYTFLPQILFTIRIKPASPSHSWVFYSWEINAYSFPYFIFNPVSILLILKGNYYTQIVKY